MSAAAPGTPRAPGRRPLRPPWRRGPVPGQPFPLSRRARLPGERDLRATTATAAVAALTLAALAVRLVAADGSLAVDEAITAARTDGSLGGVIRDLVAGGGQSPLHPVVLWLTARVAGDGDLAVRLPSIVAGALVVPVVHGLATALFDRRTGVVAAGLAVLAPILVWYSQRVDEAAMATLFVLLAVLACVRAVQDGRGRFYALHAVAAALAVWTQWLAALFVVATELVLYASLVSRRRAGTLRDGEQRSWELATVLLLCQAIPLGSYLVAAGSVDGGDGTVSFYSVVTQVSWSLFGVQPSAVTEILSAVWPLVMLATLLLMGRGASRRTGLLIACTAGPLLALLVLGTRTPNVFDVRFFAAVVPILLVLVAHATRSWARTTPARIVAAAGVAAVLAVALVHQQAGDDTPLRHDYRGALAAVPDGDVVLYLPGGLRHVVDRYAPERPARPLTAPLPTREEARAVTVLAATTADDRRRPVLDRQLGALRATRRAAGRDEAPGVLLWRFR